MTDIIEKAVDGWGDDTERTATGSFAGHAIKLVKEEYEIEQLGPTAWRLAVYVEDDTLPTEKQKELEASEAQEEFDRLVEMYDLTEDE